MHHDYRKSHFLEDRADKLIKNEEWKDRTSTKDQMIYDILSNLLLSDFFKVRGIHRQLIKDRHDQR